MFPTRVPLTLDVQEYEVDSMKNTLGWTEGLMRFKIAHYAINHSSLPTAKQLDNWGRNRLVEYCELPYFQLNNMDKFLVSYLNTKPDLRYHDIVDLTMTLVSLSTWLLDNHPAISVSNIKDVKNLGLSIHDVIGNRFQQQISLFARGQLLLIAAEAFEAAEEKILSTIENSMKPLGCSPQDSLILGLCIRRIAILYRRSFRRYKKFTTITSTLSLRRQRSKAMYEALTTAYSLIYRGAKSPFSKKWRLEDHLGAFGCNEELSDLFLEVVKYDRQYCEKHRNDEDDAHFNKIFLERREGGGPRK